MHPRIYLAGPDVFFPEAKTIAAGLKLILRKRGLEGVFPLDVEIAQTADKDGPVVAAEIFQANCDLIRGCQGVLANMERFRGPSMDVGTGFEMGMAFALGKPIVGYGITGLYKDAVFSSADAGTEIAEDRHGHAVEDFGLVDNLMVAISPAGIFPAFEEAADKMACLLGSAPVNQ